MPVGMEVGLGPDDIVLDGDPATLRKKGTPCHPPHPIFGPCLLWPNGWMDEDAAWYGIFQSSGSLYSVAAANICRHICVEKNI